MEEKSGPHLCTQKTSSWIEDLNIEIRGRAAGREVEIMFLIWAPLWPWPQRKILTGGSVLLKKDTVFPTHVISSLNRSGLQ